MNSIFQTSSQFGSPFSQYTSGGIVNSIYRTNSVNNIAVRNFENNINNRTATFSFHSVSANTTTNTLSEKTPDPYAVVDLLYKDDNSGITSADTGFFVGFKQGTLEYKDFNIVEFTTKACALDYDSMDALKNATDKPLIIINESMQFSAGVNLTYTMNFADKGDFKSIEKFIKYFQDTCKHLKYSKYPVISAPSGLVLGGGEEVAIQSNFVVAHTNIVMGLVETIVGLVPAGGGCKAFFSRA